jgi:DNA transposition AAA+ family ATPase
MTMKKKLNNNQIEAVRRQLLELAESGRYSYGDIVAATGISRTVLSEFAHGKYRGDNAKQAAILADHFETITLREGHHSKDYVHTTVAGWIERLIRQCVAYSGAEGKIGVITGDGGHGKSVCCREYAQMHPNCIYVMLDDCMLTKGVFAAIAREVGSVSSGPNERVSHALVERIRDRDMIVILDEASSLGVSTLNRLRQIIVVRGKTPLVLVGNEDINRTLSQPTTRYGFESLDQFTSRMTARVNLDELAKAEKVYTQDDIRTLFDYQGKRLSDEAVETLITICRSRRSGRLRVCSHVIAALHTSEAVGDVITTEHILAAIRQLGLPSAAWMPLAAIRSGLESHKAAAPARKRRVG